MSENQHSHGEQGRHEVVVGVGPVSIQDIVDVARHDAPVRISDDALEAIAESSARIRELAGEGVVTLMVDADNPAALKVYRRLGFRYRSVTALAR